LSPSKSQQILIFTVQHGYKMAGIGRIVPVLVLAPEPSLGHERGLELPPPWSLGYTFGVVDTDLGGHVGEVGPVVFDGIAGPDGHGGAEN
jgi:hypothetical protein